MDNKIHTVPFSAEELRKSGISRYELAKQLQRGELEKVGRGWYRVPVGDFSDEQIFQSASMRIGSPNAICLVSALSYYHLTDIIPRKVWMMVPASKQTRYRDIRLVRKQNRKWLEVGVEKISTFQITSIERTLVDCLVHHSILGTSIGIQALKQAIHENKTTLKEVMDMAVKLKVQHRIFSYIAALL